MATPNSDTKPTAAEMLKLRAGQEQGPDAAHRQIDDVGQHDEGVEKRAEGHVQQDQDQAQRQGDDVQQAMLGLLHFLKFATPFGAVGGFKQIVPSSYWASATAPARSRSRTLNFTAIRRLPCSR